VRRSFGKLPKRTGWQPALPQKRPRRQFNLDKLARFFGNFPPMKITIPQFLIALLIVCFGLLPKAQAVIPAPDGGYPGGNTAEGENAFLSLTTGGFNTAVGFLSLRAITTGSFNTAIGAGTLLVNTADENTATGAGALLSNTTGFQNTATGTVALFSNIDGTRNTANGADALFNNTTGNGNTATGSGALQNNTTGFQNTVSGASALESNTTGSNNIALGFAAGFLQTNGSSNVYIGAVVPGIAGESDACYIRSIFGQTSASGIPVLINSSNKLGTTTSSKRFKEEIKPMDKASEALLALKPVTFRYKKEIDPAGTSQFGLVAEDVEKVSPDLVVRDKEGKPYSVRYDQVNAMLLNEFLKANRKVQELEATVAQQQKNFQAKFAEQEKQIEAFASGLQKVRTQVEATKPDSQVAMNNP
jgi:hypothetical protein